MKDGDSMTATEAARLIEWLEAHGHTARKLPSASSTSPHIRHPQIPRSKKLGSPKASQAPGA